MVGGHGVCRVGVAETFRHHLQRHPFLEEQGGVSVPELVESQHRHVCPVDDPFERLRHRLWVYGVTVVVGVGILTIGYLFNLIA